MQPWRRRRRSGSWCKRRCWCGRLEFTHAVRREAHTAMEVILEGHIKGAFSGWDKGKVFVLDKGFHKKWEQVEDRYQSHYAYQPKSKLWRDGSTHYLEVEGMAEVVEVKKVR